MKIITGSPARRENFFNREKLIDKAWDYIYSGHHLLIAAPRRVGKTSLMYNLLDNPRENFIPIYLITESINSENEFFRRVVNKILKSDYATKSQKLLSFIKRYRPNIKKLTIDGIEFGSNDNINYREMLSDLLRSPMNENSKLIIMLDEFPETLENIIDDEGTNAGKHFLQVNRELRQDPEINDKVVFIYTGSIGLENIVSRLNLIKTINDLSRLKIPPLKTDEAKQFISLLLQNIEFNLSEELIDYILQKIEWLIPFYVQLIIDELRNIWRDGNLKAITKEAIDMAFNEMLEQRQHFEHWHTRIRATAKGKEYNFIKELLNLISINFKITSNEIYNLAVKYDLTAISKDITASLEYDGYINNNDDKDIYRFNSPILKMWWRQNVAN